MRNTKFVLALLLVLIMVAPLAVFAQDATPEATASSTPIMGQDMLKACPDPTNVSGTVNVGAIFALSGAASVYGLSQQAAVKLAEQQINDWHYLGNATLNVEFQDSAGDAKQAISVMTNFTEDSSIVAVLGPTLSTEANGAFPVAQDAGLPVLAVSNTQTGLRKALGDFYHRASLPESAVIPGTIAQATQLLGLKNVSVLYGNDDDFTSSAYDVFKQALADNNVNVLDTETFASADTDFSTQLTKALAQKPDALVVSALAAAAVQIINQARAQGFTGPIIGGNGFNSAAVIKQAGANAEGLIVGGAWNPANPNPSESSKEFMTAFEAANNGTVPDQFAAQAYSGLWILATAIRCGNTTDHAALNTAIGNVKNFETPLGTFSFDADGEPTHTPIAQIVQGGKFVPLTVAMQSMATPEATAAS
ncbi:MAG TPA: ABC transporter substrate-binding protein [Phototrophicaceae bacterium]|nr:ABC transporter substrate-binding protein [Phototrophicaceae bacterium]